MAHVSIITSQMPSVTFHLSPMPTATAKDPPPADSPTMHSRLVHQESTLKPEEEENSKPKESLKPSKKHGYWI